MNVRSLLRCGSTVTVVLSMLSWLADLRAATITVSTPADELNADGDCSFREALEAANTDAAVDACAAGDGEDTIVAPGSYTRFLAEPFTVRTALTIQGLGAEQSTIDGNQNGEALRVESGTVVVRGMRIRTSSRGGITVASPAVVTLEACAFDSMGSATAQAVSSSGSLTLRRSSISRHTGSTNTPIVAAGGGSFTLSNSTIEGNTSGSNASVLRLSGTVLIERTTISGNTGLGILSLHEASAVIRNTTLSGNGDGSTAIGGLAATGTTQVAVEYSTIAENRGTTTGGMTAFPGASIRLRGTILSNPSAVPAQPNCKVLALGGESGRITSDGFNLIADTTGCAIASAQGDLFDRAPGLGPLSANPHEDDGLGDTHALMATSPAIDAGGTTCPSTDQRGVSRPLDGDVNGEARCDIGAFELERCGDGFVSVHETCDDGFRDACGTCNADCSAAGSGSGVCGDGERCPEVEVCDDGFTDACGSCNADCSGLGSGSTCGDAFVCPETEGCDDGFADACGTCNADCSAAGVGAACGDGALCPELEGCDDGNTQSGDGCSSRCDPDTIAPSVTPPTDEGCSCRAAPGVDLPLWLVLAGLALASRARTRRRRR